MIINFISCVAFPQSSLFVPFTRLESKNGLSSPNVRAIIQDKYGFMWFGTQEGLSRYDGYKFINYNSDAQDKKHLLLSNDVYDLAIDSSGDYLWAITTYGGLSRIDIKTTNTLQLFPLNSISKKSNSLWFIKICFTGKYIFIATNEGVVAKFNTVTDSVEAVLDLSTYYHPGNINVEQIIADKNGLVWLFIANKGILAYSSDLKSEIASIPRSELNVPADAELHFKSVNKEKSGDLIVGASAGLKFISVNEHKLVSSKNFATNPFHRLINYSVNAIADYREGLIIGTTSGLFRCDCKNNIFQQILPAVEVNDLDWFNTASVIYSSNENIWIGSQFGVGLIKKVDIPFTGYFSSFNGNNIRIRHAVNLLALNDSVFFSCGTDGFYKVNLTAARIEKYGRNEPYYSFLKLPGNYIIAGGKNGMDLITSNGEALNISRVFPELSAIKNDFLTAALQYNDSLFLMGSEYQNGMYVWNIKKRAIDIINTHTEPLHLKSNVINGFYVTRNKKVLILCDNQVSVYDPLNKSINHPDIFNPKTKEALNIIMDVCEVGNDYYFAVYGVGIVCTDATFRIKKIYADYEGLHNTGLYKIFSVGDTSVITSSNDGLALLNTKNDKITMYYESDGLQSNSFEEKSGYKNGDIIFMGGINGFTKIDPSKFISNTTPPVLYFTGIQTKIKDNPIDIDTINLQINEYTIGNNWLQTNIYFTGLNYRNQDRVTYQYRIKGQNPSWVNLGNQNFVSLLGLSPGSYVLEVKAANEDGYWSQPKQLTLIFQPKWYQTMLFKIFTGLFIAFLLYAFYRYRLTQLRKQHQIRKEIASDLHDDIGATLNSVKIFTHLAETSPERQKYFTLITEALSQASAGLRDMIWVLDDAGDTAGDLLKRLQMFVHPVAEATGIKVGFSADGAGNIILNKTEKRNLLLIAKEAINNSIKYADCKNILVLFARLNNKTTLIVQDDGKGFVAHKINPGNGLKNMKDRAHQVHYKITVESAVGSGTKITVVKK